jgi:hypothetical protein
MYKYNPIKSPRASIGVFFSLALAFILGLLIRRTRYYYLIFSFPQKKFHEVSAAYYPTVFEKARLAALP